MIAAQSLRGSERLLAGFRDPNPHDVGTTDLLSLFARVVSIDALPDRLSAATMRAQQQWQGGALRAVGQKVQDLAHLFRELHATRHDLTNLAPRPCYGLHR